MDADADVTAAADAADARADVAGDGATDAAGLVDGLKRARDGDDDDVDDDVDDDDMDDDIDEDDEGMGDGDGEERGGARGASGAGAARAGGEDADDQLLLARHTKVIISGNNRTKGKLIGLKGVVKKAVGLGGWHWLALSNGQEVRLQRNALTVLEHPTGDEVDSEDGNEDDVENGEEDDDDDEENDDDEDEDEDDDEDKDKNTRSRRPTRVPGNGPPSQAAAAAMKRLQDRRRNARPNCQSNFERLTMTTLLKYKKLYELPPNPEVDGNKSALVHEIAKHFMSQKLDEQKVLQQFMCSVADTTQL